MSDKKEKELDSKKITKLLVTVLGGVAQKLSVSFILNAKKQVDDAVSRIKRGILAGFFVIFGSLFLLIGLAVYLEAVCDFFPGGGYLIVGGSSILLAILIALIRK
jgi:hypothetical protein